MDEWWQRVERIELVRVCRETVGLWQRNLTLWEVSDGRLLNLTNHLVVCRISAKTKSWKMARMALLRATRLLDRASKDPSSSLCLSLGAERYVGRQYYVGILDVLVDGWTGGRVDSSAFFIERGS